MNFNDHNNKKGNITTKLCAHRKLWSAQLAGAHRSNTAPVAKHVCFYDDRNAHVHDSSNGGVNRKKLRH